MFKKVLNTPLGDTKLLNLIKNFWKTLGTLLGQLIE